MRFPFSTLCVLLLAGCCAPTAQLKERERGVITATNHLHVRTTSYTGKYNGIGERLHHGPVVSAASDWSQFPLGTRFRICGETKRTFVIDDYGSALAGTRTIDLCAACTREMHQWGARWVDIEVLEWGSARRSLEVLSPREHAWYVRIMTAALRRQAGGIPQQFHRVKE